MKVVIVHDWLTGFRGGERVLEAILELFPKAPIYTLIHQKGSTSPLIESREIRTSFLNRIPGIYRNYRKYLPLMPFAAGSLKLPADTDLVISSSHCVIKGVSRPPFARHLSYVHSPMRYMYDQFDNYFGHASFPVRYAARIFRPYLQLWDRDSNRNVDVMISNSHFVSERIKQFYGITSKTIHPFVDLSDFRWVQKNPPPKQNFYLMVTAFAPNKKVDLAIKAFNHLGSRYPLKIIGSGSYEDEVRLRAMAGPHIQFLGNLGREEVISNMAKAHAFIFPGIEDFGITPLESLAAGTPVIAFAAGGVLETLTNETAKFFKESLAEAVTSFRQDDYLRESLHARAEQFSKERFQSEILSQVEALFSTKNIADEEMLSGRYDKATY